MNDLALFVVAVVIPWAMFVTGILVGRKWR